MNAIKSSEIDLEKAYDRISLSLIHDCLEEPKVPHAWEIWL